MNLFNEKKNMFLKIINIILLLWFIGALIVCYASVVNLIFPQPTQTYQEYRMYNCRVYENEGKDAEPKYYEDCQDRYDIYKANEKNNNYYNLKNLLIAFGNVVIVGTTLLYLNKKK